MVRFSRGAMFGGALAIALAATGSAGEPGRGQERPRAITRDLASVRDWTVHYELRFLPTPPPDPVQGATTNLTTALHLDAVDLVFPLIGATSMSEPWPEKLRWEWRVENRYLREPPRIEDGYQGLSQVATWHGEAIDGLFMSFFIEVSARCYETRVNEAVARSYGWQGAAWSPELALMLEPQLFVECGDARIVNLVNEWTRGKPRAARPYDLAKFLAAKAIDLVEITRNAYGSSLETDRNAGSNLPAGTTNIVPIVTGLQVSGAAAMAEDRKGSPVDLVCLYVALCRAAGLPTRMVIGFDINESKRWDAPILRAWAEVFLPTGSSRPKDDPKADPIVTPEDGEWVPVDIASQKQFSSKAPPLNTEWRYFGHNEDFDYVPPIAHHLVPPADVTALGAPALWGWRPSPLAPVASVEMKLWAFDMPRVSKDMSRKPSQR